MGLLAAYRRSWFLIVVGLLTLPMIGEALRPMQAVSESEARGLAPLPAVPRTVADWRLLPVALDSFLRDHFGFRDTLTRLHGLWRIAIGMPSRQDVVIGREGHLFLNVDDAIAQSLGRLVRRGDIARAADRMAQLAERLQARGTRLIVAPPPNAETIEQAALPTWAGAPSTPTEYDLMLTALAARGINAVDLRPALFAERRRHPVYYKTDTHWNLLGALIGHNAVVDALGHADWRIAPERVVRGFATIPGGDAARMLNIARDVSDRDAEIDLSSYAPMPGRMTMLDAHLPDGAFAIEMPRAGPTIVVIGDSFARAFWSDYFALHAARYVWLRYERCAFSDDLVESFSPDVVIVAPTERYMTCTVPKPAS
jgi:hypothetical protein